MLAAFALVDVEAADGEVLGSTPLPLTLVGDRARTWEQPEELSKIL